MPTIKQMEAVYWVHSLGGFHAAAARLNTTQSTISKRIQEIEADLGGRIFDRTPAGPALTARGRALIEGFSEILALRSRLVGLARGQGGLGGRLRLGVTELVSLTWLPPLVAALRQRHPELALEPEIDLSRNLYDRLAARRLDMVLGPRIAREEELATLPLGTLDCAWVCAPGLAVGEAPLSMEALARLPLLLQPEGSAIQLLLLREEAGQHPVQGMLSCNNLAALTRLAVAGLGVTYGPLAFFAPLLRQGRLRQLATRQPLPPLDFIAAWRPQPTGGLLAEVAELARQAAGQHRADEDVAQED